jgi:hypothetical protein
LLTAVFHYGLVALKQLLNALNFFLSQNNNFQLEEEQQHIFQKRSVVVLSELS